MHNGFNRLFQQFFQRFNEFPHHTRYRHLILERLVHFKNTLQGQERKKSERRFFGGREAKNKNILQRNRQKFCKTQRWDQYKENLTDNCRPSESSGIIQ